MTGWLALVATLSAAYAIADATGRPTRARFDGPLLLAHLVTGAVSGWLIAAAARAWIVPTVLAAAGVAFHLARLRQATTTTHNAERESSDES